MKQKKLKNDFREQGYNFIESNKIDCSVWKGLKEQIHLSNALKDWTKRKIVYDKKKELDEENR